MQLTPLNREKYTIQRADGMPADWDNEITFRGVSRATASGHYVVKLTVSGTQFFLGNAYSQKTAAKLYDYAVWKFAGKMSRAMRVNFPESFSDITQADIDRDCPRLNELYLKIPFVSASDSAIAESELRAARLTQEKFVSPPPGAEGKDYYLVVLARLKRLRLQSSENFERVTDWHSKLGLLKVPDIYNRLAAVSTHYAALTKEIQDLEASMESQHSFYRKVTYGEAI